MRKFILIAAVVFSLSVIQAFGQEQAGMWKLNLRADKTEYPLWEDIVFILEFQNSGDKDQALFFNLNPGENLEFKVVGPEKEDDYFVAPVVQPHDSSEADFEVVGKGLSVKYSYIFNKYNSYLLDPGEYRVTCVYRNDKDGYDDAGQPVSMNAFKGELASNEVVITIKE